MVNYNTSGVYVITNLINGKRYIGSSYNMRRRWNEHRSVLKRNKSTNYVLQRAWNSYGADAFAFSVLEYVEDHSLLIPTEQKYLDELRPEYNIRKIADRCTGLKRSAETRAKMSAAAKGRARSDEQKAYMREIMTGRQFTPEWKEHLKEAGARRVFTDEDKAKFQQRMNEPDIVIKRSQALRGRKWTPEQRQHLSEVHSQRLQDPEARNAFLTAMNTPEIKAKRARARQSHKQSEPTKNNPTLWDEAAD